MKRTKNVLVFGGTGYYGRNVVRHLLKNNHSVKVVSRNANNAVKLLGAEVVIVEGDVADQDVLKKSMKDTDAIVICLSAVSRKLIRRMKEIEYDAVIRIMQEAKIANISRLVYFSGYDYRSDVLKKLNIPEFADLKIAVESKIKESDFNWTILGCAPSQEIFFTFIRNGKMAVPGGGKNAIPSISEENVGEIAAQAVVRDDLNGKRFRLTGPKAYSFPEVAEFVSREKNKLIKHITIPLFLVNMVSFILIPFIPFVRFIYKSLLLLNNFPEDLASRVPEDHKILRETFEYEPITLESEIVSRITNKML